LAETLLQRTLDHRIAWKIEDAEGGTFSFATNSARIVVEAKDQDGQAPFRLVLQTIEGEEVDTLEQYEQQGTSYKRSPWTQTLEDLFFAARRNALNIDDVLERVFKELGIDETDDDPASEPPLE
jgi:hypothetical protein